MRLSSLFASLLLALAACSGVSVDVDRQKLASIRKVAVVVFNLPVNVSSDSSSGGTATSVGFILSAVQNKGLTNGVQVADDTLPGFIGAIRDGGRFEILPHDQVAANAGFVSLRDAQGKKQLDSNAAAPKGLVNVKIKAAENQPEFVVKAASALGVDGVIVVLTRKLQYRVYNGVDASGTAKAVGTFDYSLYSADGTPVWSDVLSTTTDETGPIIGGIVNPAHAKNLHQDLGKVIYREAAARLEESAKQGS